MQDKWAGQWLMTSVGLDAAMPPTSTYPLTDDSFGIGATWCVPPVWYWPLLQLEHGGSC